MHRLGQQLRHYRQLNELQPADVAFMLGLAETQYLALENDQAELPLKLVIKLCRYYQISPEELLTPESIPEAASPIAEQPLHPAPEAAETTIDEDEEPDYPNYNLDRSKRHVTAKQAQEILRKNGTEVNETEAEGALDLMYNLAAIALSQAERELRWQRKLERYTQGFAIKGKKYSCRLCGSGSEEDQRWYDRYGLKCMACQHAVDKGIIPGELATDNTLFYSEFDLGHYFSLKGKDLKDWIKKGLLKPRIIPRTNGKGKHYQVFLISDHGRFLPPLTMMRIGGLIEEKEDGKKFIRGTQWYEHVDPFEYLKDYGIIKYMRYKELPPDVDKPPDS